MSLVKGMNHYYCDLGTREVKDYRKFWGVLYQIIIIQKQDVGRLSAQQHIFQDGLCHACSSFGSYFMFHVGSHARHLFGMHLFIITCNML